MSLASHSDQSPPPYGPSSVNSYATPGGSNVDYGTHAPFIPSFTSEYYQYSVVSYNTMSLITRKLNFPWMTFATGMTYVHRFAEQHGWAAIHPVVLACAAFLLAGKVENYGQIRITRIVKAVFGANISSDAGAAEVRRNQIVTAEMMLLHGLNFDVLVKLPYSRMSQLLDIVTPVMLRSELKGRKPLLEPVSTKILAYTYMSPLAAHLEEHRIAEGILLMLAEALGVLDDVLGALAVAGQSPSIGPDELHGVRQVVYTVLVYSRKKVGIETIDNVALHRRRSAIAPRDNDGAP